MITVSDNRRSRIGTHPSCGEQSMPQGGMEDVCRVVVTMSDPMSHEFSLQVPQDFEELDRLGWGSLHSDGPGHDDLYEWPVTVIQKTTSRCLPPVIVL